MKDVTFQKPKTVRPSKRRSNGLEKNGLTKKVKLNLPKDYPWKVLTALGNDLAEFLTADEVELLNQIIRDRDFFSYRLLSETWGLQFYSTVSLADSQHVSCLRAKYQLSALLKKYQFDTDKDIRKTAALDKLYQSEVVCQEYNHSGYTALCWGETEEDVNIFSDAKAFLQKLLGDKACTKDIITRWSRHGPGSNLDTYKGNSNIYYKYANWPYSCTVDALPVARFLIQSNKRWLGYLENSYRKRFDLSKTLILNREVFWASVFKVVPGNRITTVPKSAETDRTIAIEPAMNLMLQLGVDGYIRSRLKRWDIDLDSQVKNQNMAYRGSIDPTSDSYSTLDLAAASDSISLKVCEMLLPPKMQISVLKSQKPRADFVAP